MRTIGAVSALLCAYAAAACGSSSSPAGGTGADGGDDGAFADDGSVADDGSTAVPDATTNDTGSPEEAGSGDGGAVLDATGDVGMTSDGGENDGSTEEASLADGGDAGTTDAASDGAVPDSSVVDAGVVDAGSDAGIVDSGSDVVVAPTYTLGGTISGLGAGDTLTLQNGSDVLQVTTTPFTFDVALANSASFSVSVTGETGPVPQSCTVTSNATGTIAGADFANVGVTCTNTYSVGGTLAGLTVGESIVLQDQAGNPTTLSANGPFVLPNAVALGSTWGVAIKTAPSSPIAQTCSITNSGGTISGAVTNVTVDCDMLAYFPFSGDATDASGYGNNGALNGAPTLTADRNGVANSAYAFDGASYIDAAMPSGFLPDGDESRSMTAWLQPTQSTSEWGVVYYGAGNCSGLQFGIGDQGGSNATFWGGCDDFESNLTIPIGMAAGADGGLDAAAPTWTFVALTYSQSATGTINLYVGSAGTLASTTGNINDLATPVASDLIMGADLINGPHFVGNLDSIRVYGRTLTAAEVQSIFASTAP